MDHLWIGEAHIQSCCAFTSLSQDKASVLPMFHALTGCDTVSFFGGRGKKTAWDTWMRLPELTPVLRSLKSSPASIADDSMDVIERFVVLLYDQTSSLTKVNDARQGLFSKKSRNLDKIPPIRAVLVQHTKRAVFQGGYVSGQALLKQAVLPSPSDYGWIRDEGLEWLPYWTSLPQVKDTCSELIKYSCKSAYRGHCKCSEANLACMGLCK